MYIHIYIYIHIHTYVFASCGLRGTHTLKLSTARSFSHSRVLVLFLSQTKKI